MSSGLLPGVLQLVIWGGWLATMMWGSVMALRGARNWATILQVIGIGSILAGMMSAFVGGIFAISTMAGPSGPGSSLMGGVRTWTALLGGGALLALLGVLLFTAGYIGMCAKYVAVHRRARELEGLVGQLQERMQSGV